MTTKMCAMYDTRYLPLDGTNTKRVFSGEITLDFQLAQRTVTNVLLPIRTVSISKRLVQGPWTSLQVSSFPAV